MNERLAAPVNTCFHIGLKTNAWVWFLSAVPANLLVHKSLFSLPCSVIPHCMLVLLLIYPFLNWFFFKFSYSLSPGVERHVKYGQRMQGFTFLFVYIHFIIPIVLFFPLRASKRKASWSSPVPTVYNLSHSRPPPDELYIIIRNVFEI